MTYWSGEIAEATTTRLEDGTAELRFVGDAPWVLCSRELIEQMVADLNILARLRKAVNG